MVEQPFLEMSASKGWRFSVTHAILEASSHARSPRNTIRICRFSAGAQAERAPSAWIKVGAIAAASALAGGLAAAWFYRKTLNRLRQAESDGGMTGSAIHDPNPEDF